MTTNDERRQAAAKLRKADDACDFLCALGLKCDSDCEDCSSHNFVRKVGGVLADLIDPTPDYTQTQVTSCCPCGARATCTLLGTVLHEYRDGQLEYEHELSCGHVAWGDDPKPPNFCGECGSMVVSE